MNDQRRRARLFAFGNKNGSNPESDIQDGLAAFPQHLAHNVVLLPVTLPPDLAGSRRRRKEWAAHAAPDIVDRGVCGDIATLVVRPFLPRTLRSRERYFDRYADALASQIGRHGVKATTLETVVCDDILRDNEDRTCPLIGSLVAATSVELSLDVSDPTGIVVITDKLTADQVRRSNLRAAIPSFPVHVAA